MSVAQGLAPGGLVSLPTTHTHAPTVIAAHHRREEVGAIAAAPRARVARMRRSVGFSARAIQAQRVDGYVAMVTLTYRDGRDWQPEHMARFMNAMRMHAKRADWKLRYVWVAELQQRGAIHYHVLVWLPPGVMLPKPDQVGWWPHGGTKIEAARSAIGYVMKYVSKAGRGKLPRGARMHGAGGLEHVQRRARRWLGLPSFVRARSDVHDDWRPARGGGWRSPEGFVVPSEWRRVYVGDRWCVQRVADYGRPFAAEGPFTWLHRGRHANR